MSGIVIACCGAVVGIGLAVIAVRLVESLVSSDYLWGVTSRDPIVLGNCPAASSFNITQTQLVAWDT